MDTRLKNIVDNLETMKIGVDEPFPFHLSLIHIWTGITIS